MRVAMRILAFGLMVTLAASVRADVFNMGGGQTSISLVPVGNPGNANDPATGNSTAPWATTTASTSTT